MHCRISDILIQLDLCLKHRGNCSEVLKEGGHVALCMGKKDRVVMVARCLQYDRPRASQTSAPKIGFY